MKQQTCETAADSKARGLYVLAHFFKAFWEISFCCRVEHQVPQQGVDADVKTWTSVFTSDLTVHFISWETNVQCFLLLLSLLRFGELWAEAEAQLESLSVFLLFQSECSCTFSTVTCAGRDVCWTIGSHVDCIMMWQRKPVTVPLSSCCFCLYWAVKPVHSWALTISASVSFFFKMWFSSFCFPWKSIKDFTRQEKSTMWHHWL